MSKSNFYILSVILLVSMFAYSASADKPGTCANSCGGHSKSSDCYCDDSCTNYGDCCTDYAEVCASVSSDSDTGSTSSIPQDSEVNSESNCPDELQNKIPCNINTNNCIQSCGNENYYCSSITFYKLPYLQKRYGHLEPSIILRSSEG